MVPAPTASNAEWETSPERPLVLLWGSPGAATSVRSLVAATRGVWILVVSFQAPGLCPCQEQEGTSRFPLSGVYQEDILADTAPQWLLHSKPHSTTMSMAFPRPQGWAPGEAPGCQAGVGTGTAPGCTLAALGVVAVLGAGGGQTWLVQPYIFGYTVPHPHKFMEMSSSSEILSSAMSSLLTSPSKAFFISVTMFFLSSLSFLFFLSIFLSLHSSSILTCCVLFPLVFFAY